MLEVGCPDPALVEERTESTRSCAARSATALRLLSEVSSVIVMITPVLLVGCADDCSNTSQRRSAARAAVCSARPRWCLPTRRLRPRSRTQRPVAPVEDLAQAPGAWSEQPGRACGLRCL